MTTHHAGPLLNQGTLRDRKWFRNLPMQFDPDYIVLWDDFTREALDSATDHRWNEVKDTGASSSIATDEVGGILDLASAATTDGDGASLQGNAIFQPASGKDIWFEARVRLHDADDQDFYVGLTEAFATNPEAVFTESNRIGFQVTEGDASILCKTEASDSESSNDSGIDAVDLTYIVLGFHVIGTDVVEFYVNRILKQTVTTNIPTVAMAAAIASISGSATGTFVTSCDYIACVAER